MNRKLLEEIKFMLEDIKGNRHCPCYKHNGPCPRCLTSYRDVAKLLKKLKRG